MGPINISTKILPTSETATPPAASKLLTRTSDLARNLFSAKKLKEIFSEPRRILNAIYYMCTGVSMWKLQQDEKNYKGTVLALAALREAQGHCKFRVLDLQQQTMIDVSEDKDTKDLRDLFSYHGSDKSTVHNYHLVYGSILKGKRDHPLRILEFGIGTNNIDIPCNMGKDGKPGASLRAFRDWAPNSSVIGADIDQRILFSEERISTFYVDQTDVVTLKALGSNFPKGSFDLIIADGLHNTWANLNTVVLGLDLLKTDGIIVVEDIPKEHIPVWQIASSILDNNRKSPSVMTKTQVAYVFIIQCQ